MSDDMDALTEELGGLLVSKRDHAYAHARARAFVNDVVVPLIAEREAKRWDEGWNAAKGSMWADGDNPYRSAVSGEPGE